MEGKWIKPEQVLYSGENIATDIWLLVQKVQTGKRPFAASGIERTRIAQNRTTGMIMKHNQFIMFYAGKYTVNFNSQNQIASTFLDFGVADCKYYITPFNTNVVKTLATDNKWAGIDYTLSGWQTFSGQDANSNKSPVSISSENDLKFEYNATKKARTISLSSPIIDIKGTRYSGSITLQPYTSVVLMKDTN